MQTYRTLSMVPVLLLTACVRGFAPAPAVVPAPAPDSAAIARSSTSAARPDGAVADPPPAQQAGAAVDPPGDSAKLASDSSRLSTGDVKRGAADVFGDSTASAPDSASAATEPSWDMEVRSYESVDRVQYFVQRFSGPARARIESWLTRGTRYEPMIRATMRKGGLPEDMYYLALVESGFDVNAYSRAAAVGMWQFMTSTGRDMGLRVDWWVDERRDPVRSTMAAVRFIAGLRDQFGSLYLAAAAYDGGPGRIARGLTRYADDLQGTSGEDLFFALAGEDYLKSETKDYVPQLIAAALVGKDPARYGMHITPLPPFVYDSVRVGPGTPLAAIAAASDTSVAAIRELNTAILRGMTPPRDSLQVRIPVGAALSFADNFAALPRTDRVGYRTVETRKGDRLSTLARRAGVSTSTISAFNPDLTHSKKTGRLYVGQQVLVPTAAVVAAADAVPDPAIENYPSSRRGAASHVVKHGETLSGIAVHYHTTVKSLMTLNGLRRPMIFAGQELVIRGRAVHRATKSRTKRSSAHRKAPKK